MTSRYHTRSNSATKSSGGPNHSHSASNCNTNSKGLSRHRPLNNEPNNSNSSPGMTLWHDHTSVTGQKCNSGLVAERRREGINDFSIDDSNVYIQSFHHTTGSNPFIPQSINFSISHFNFIDNMDNRTSVRSQSKLPPPPLHERQVVLPTENPPTILPSQHHIFHREVPTHLSAHHHHFSPLYSQSMFNSIRIQFYRVHLYRQSIFNSHQDSISSTHGLFQNLNLEIANCRTSKSHF